MAKVKSNQLNNDLRAQFIKLAYHIGDRNSYIQKVSDLNHSLDSASWRLLCDSSMHEETNRYGYKAVAFYNEQIKQVHIATAGTNKTDFMDLLDDIFIFFGWIPHKIVTAKAMTAKVVEFLRKLGQEEHDYTFSTSGHSLGGIMSDLTAAEIISRGLSFIKSTTYDNPGSKTAVQKAIEGGYLTGKTHLEEVADKSVVYNVQPNVINCTQPQLGDVHLVVSDKQINKISPILSYWYYIFYRITSMNEGLEAHGLASFAAMKQFFKIGKNKWEDKIDGKLVVDRNSVKNIDISTGNDFVTVEQENASSDDGRNSVTKFRYYGYADLKLAGEGEIVVDE